VGFEPAYGNYRRHTPQGQGADDEEEDEEDDGDFLEWARIIGERSEAGAETGGNQHRRLGAVSQGTESSQVLAVTWVTPPCRGCERLS